MRTIPGTNEQLSPIIGNALEIAVSSLETKYNNGEPFPEGKLKAAPSKAAAKRMRVNRAEFPSASDRQRHHITIPERLSERAVNALSALAANTAVADNFSELVEQVLRTALAELSTLHNGGQPFPPFTGQLRSGRRRIS